MVSVRPTRGAVSRDYWEQSVSFIQSVYQTVEMGVHDYDTAEGGTGKNRFSIVISAAPTVATIILPAMFPSVPLRGIPTTMLLLSPAVPPTIYPR